MTYVRQRQTAEVHACPLPMRDMICNLGMLDSSGETSRTKVGSQPSGSIGDLWRCDECGVLWRIALRSDFEARRRAGYMSDGPKWFRAGLWQRFRYRKAGHALEELRLP